MNAVMTAEMIRYETNFVRSAIAPDTIVTAVAANTTWKKKTVAVVRNRRRPAAS